MLRTAVGDGCRPASRDGARLLRGEDLESASRGITAARASQWRDQFLAARPALRAPDATGRGHSRLQAKMVSDGERTALREGGPLEAGRPFGPAEVR